MTRRDKKKAEKNKKRKQQNMLKHMRHQAQLSQAFNPRKSKKKSRRAMAVLAMRNIVERLKKANAHLEAVQQDPTLTGEARVQAEKEANSEIRKALLQANLMGRALDGGTDGPVSRCLSGVDEDRVAARKAMAKQIKSEPAWEETIREKEQLMRALEAEYPNNRQVKLKRKIHDAHTRLRRVIIDPFATYDDHKQVIQQSNQECREAVTELYNAALADDGGTPGEIIRTFFPDGLEGAVEELLVPELEGSEDEL